MSPATRPTAPTVALRLHAWTLALMLLAGAALAQAPAGPAPAPDASGGDDREDGPVALVSVGLAGGFPAYQTGLFRAAIQLGAIGADVRAGYGPQAGASFGATLRGYPSLPGLPVPVWVGAGVMATAGSPAPFAAAGVHVPVAPRWRVDVEAGAAWTRLGLETRVVPHVLLGVSYAFALAAPVARPDRAEAPEERPERVRCEPGPPDAGLLEAAVRAAERRFVNDARATYGSLYRDLRYTLDVRSERLDGAAATLILAYDGSVTEIASGRRISASGDAEADFRWGGCGWTLADLRY